MYHPDRSQEKNKKKAEKRFASLAAAYEVLVDPKVREEYDIAMAKLPQNWKPVFGETRKVGWLIGCFLNVFYPFY